MNPEYSGTGEITDKCYLRNEKVVTSYDQLPDPISESNYYKFFEYTDQPPKNTDDFQKMCTMYSEEYLSDGKMTYLSTSICTSTLHSQLCEKCIPSIFPECRDCSISIERSKCNTRNHKKARFLTGEYNNHCELRCSFAALLRITLSLPPTYACPSNKAESPCKKCRYVAEMSNLPSDRRQITVHDIRLFGHPLHIYIHYDYHRCKRKQYYLSHLPGISESSGYNQTRFSIRLAERINAAIVERIPLNYISEASAVSYDTIRRWTRRTEHRAESEMSKVKCFMHLTDQSELETQCLDIQFSSIPFKLCLHANESGTEVSGLYCKEAWEALDQVLRTGDADKLVPLQRFGDVTDGYYLLYNMVFDYFCDNQAPRQILQPAITSFMVTNLIMGYLGCRILPLLGLPEFANKDYLDGIWDYFQSELFDEPMEGNSQMLSFLPALAFFDLTKLPDSMEGEFLGWQAISSLDADSLKHIYPFARHRILTNQKAEIEQSTRKVEVREEEIPLLLLYFNPIMLTDRNPNYQSHLNAVSGSLTKRYCFDKDGEFDYETLLDSGRPFILLNHLIRCLKAGILSSPDPLIVPLSEKLRRIAEY